QRDLCLAPPDVRRDHRRTTKDARQGMPRPVLSDCPHCSPLSSPPIFSPIVSLRSHRSRWAFGGGLTTTGHSARLPVLVVATLFLLPTAVPAQTVSFIASRNLGSPGSVAVGDFNGDGKLDLATTGAVLLGNGDGTFQAPLKFVPEGTPFSVAVGDFNGDGIPDLTVGTGEMYGFTVLLGNGDGTFRAPLSNNVPADSVAVGDFN